MSWGLPGYDYQIENTGYIYIEGEGLKSQFRKYFYDITEHSPYQPEEGGTMNEEAVIETPQGAFFHGISYTSDIGDWYRSVTEWCSANQRRWAVLRDGMIVLSSGESYPINQCKLDHD